MTPQMHTHRCLDRHPDPKGLTLPSVLQHMPAHSQQGLLGIHAVILCNIGCYLHCVSWPRMLVIDNLHENELCASCIVYHSHAC